MTVHPTYVLTPDDRMGLKAWLRQRQTGGALPFAGGYLDQPAWLIRAFGIMDGVAYSLDEAKRQREALAKRDR